MNRRSSGAGSVAPAWWPLANIDDAAKGLAFVAREVLAGRLDPRSANAATSALNALIGALRDAQLERRIDAIESVTGSVKRAAA